MAKNRLGDKKLAQVQALMPPGWIADMALVRGNWEPGEAEVWAITDTGERIVGICNYRKGIPFSADGPPFQYWRESVRHQQPRDEDAAIVAGGLVANIAAEIAASPQFAADLAAGMDPASALRAHRARQEAGQPRNEDATEFPPAPATLGDIEGYSGPYAYHRLAGTAEHK